MENINIASFDFDDAKILNRLEEIKKNIDELNESRFLEQKRLSELNKEYNSITKEMEKLTNSGKGQSKEFEDLANKQGQYLKNIVQSKSAISDITTETRQLNTESKLLNSTIETQAKQQELLSKGYDVESKNINQLREDRKLLIQLRNQEIAVVGEQSEQAKKLNELITKTTNQEQKLASESEQRFYKIGEYSKELNGHFSDLKDGITDLASGNVISGVDKLKTSFNGLLTTTKAFLATPIGIAITTLTGFIAISKYIYDYNTEMAQATKLTQQFTGLLGEDLEKATVRAKSFADTTGEDLKEVTRSVNAVAKAYGISFDEAFNKVQKGYVKAGQSAEDFFDNTDEYIIQFKNAGYSADEFFSILEAGAQNGTYKDKIVDSVKEIELKLKDFAKGANDELTNAFGKDFANKLSKGLADGTINSKEALKQIGDEAKKVGVNFQDQQRIVANVFGAMGEDAGGFVKVVDTIALGLDKSTESLTDLQKAQSDLIDKSNELDQAFSELFNMTGGGFETMITDIKVIAFDLLIKMINGVKDLKNWFVELYNQSALVRGVIQVIYLSFKYLGKSVIETASVLYNFGAILGNVLTGNIDGAKKNLEDLKNSAKTFGSDLAKDVSKAFKEVGFGSLQAQTTKSNLPTNNESELGLGSGSKTIDEKALAKAKKEADKILKQKLKDEEKARKEAEKALEDAYKLEQKYLEDYANLTYQYSQDELANQIKNNGEKIKNAKILTDELVNIERERLKQIEKLEQDKIDKERAEADRKAQDTNEQASIAIQDLKVSEERRNQLRLEADNVLKAQLDLNEQKFNQKTLENQNTTNLALDALDLEYQENKNAIEQQRREFEFQQNLLSLENQGNTEREIKLAQLNEQYNQELARYNQLRADGIITQQQYDQASLNLTENKAKQEEETERIVNNQKLSVIGDTLGQVSQLLGENTKAGKIAGSAQALINTYQGITEVWKTPSTLPEPFATISKVGSTATVLASGLQAVKQINKVSTDSISSSSGGISSGGTTTNTYKSSYAGGSNGLDGLSISGYNQQQTFGSTNDANAIADAVREGARQGSSEGSSEGIIGLSTNRQILNDATY